MISKIKHEYKYYDRKNNSASFFIEFAAKITKDKGIITYIVPKSLSFSEGWHRTRNYISQNNRLINVVDVSKAFEEVLLEQIIISFSKRSNYNYEDSFIASEGWGESINTLGKVKNYLIKDSEILPIYATSQKLVILEKIRKGSIPLYLISKTFRGLPLQSKISPVGTPILRGRNIGKYLIYGKICKIILTDEMKSSKKILEIMKPKIVSQNIIAHVMNPYERIIIMATFDKQSLLTLDTVMNTILTSSEFTYEYIIALLNSRLASWFYYWFVYNRSIRTIHFDSYYIGKLPIKKIDLIKQQPLINIVDKILAITKDDDYLDNSDKRAKVHEYEHQIDQLVYKLYGLTDEEIKLIEKNK